MYGRYGLWLWICLSLIASPAFSQLKEVEHYPFINYDANKIEYYGTSKKAFLDFYRKFTGLIKAGKRQIRILHIGDSHLQADFFSGRVRADFQSFMPGLQGARGMISPYKQGCPDSYRITYGSQWEHHSILSSSSHQSIFANTIYTTDSFSEIQINVNFHNPVKYDFNSFRIYHSPLSEDSEIIADCNGITYNKEYIPENTYTTFTLTDYTDRVTIKVNKKQEDSLYIYGFYFDNEDAGVVYNAVGVNSATALHYLGIDTDGILETLDLDLVIISLGTNDCYEESGLATFKSRLTEMIEQIRKSVPTTPILLTTPSDCWYKRKKINERMQKAERIIKETAQLTNCGVWDWYAIMGAKSSSTKWVQNKLMQKDKVHLTLKGYYLQGDMLYNALWSEIENEIFTP